MKIPRYLNVIMGFILFSFVVNGNSAKAQSKGFTMEIPFKEPASGGTLHLVEALNRNAGYWTIETKSGEGGESIVNHLTSVRVGGIDWTRIGGMTPEKMRASMAQGTTLRLGGRIGTYFLSGTEIGLGIPMSPLSLSAKYAPEADEVIAEWSNPPGGYDSIAVVLVWGDDLHTKVTATDGKTQKFSIDRRSIPVEINDLDIRIIGLRAGVPSAAAAIHLNGRRQEEISGFPFARNLAPNWSFWSTAGPNSTGVVSQGQKYNYLGRSYAHTYVLSTRPFYQIICAPQPGQSYGVWRQFLGLTGGHRYRIIACVSTLDIENVNGDWSYSLHTAANDTSGAEFTSEQMAGLTALPDGRKGPPAAQVASYGPGKTTGGKFEIIVSDENAIVTMPKDADKITVWVRLSCSDPNGKMGFSGVALEDITGEAKIDNTDGIKLRETREEERVIREGKGRLSSKDILR